MCVERRTPVLDPRTKTVGLGGGGGRAMLIKGLESAEKRMERQKGGPFHRSHLRHSWGPGHPMPCDRAVSCVQSGGEPA